MTEMDDKLKACIDLAMNSDMTDQVRAIFTEYKVEKGIIKSPGKFEAEPWYAVIVYDWIMNGDGEDIYEGDEDDSVLVETVFEMTEPERRLFDFEAKVIALHENDQGFVHVYPKEEPKPKDQESCFGLFNAQKFCCDCSKQKTCTKVTAGRATDCTEWDEQLHIYYHSYGRLTSTPKDNKNWGKGYFGHTIEMDIGLGGKCHMIQELHDAESGKVCRQAFGIGYQTMGQITTYQNRKKNGRFKKKVQFFGVDE